MPALRQLGRTALAATAYRDKHGKYPRRLEELVPAFLPAMPVDPRDGQVLHVKHFPGLSVLYTLQDSPGLEAEASWDAEKHQEVAFYRNASQPATASGTAPVNFDRLRDVAIETGATAIVGPPPSELAPS